MHKHEHGWQMPLGVCQSDQKTAVLSSPPRQLFEYAEKWSRKRGIPQARNGVAVFVHGCFWHRHPGCKYAYTPKSRQEFWSAKFQENIGRHDAAVRALNDLGWKVLVVWECEIRDEEQLAARLKEEIASGC